MNEKFRKVVIQIPIIGNFFKNSDEAFSDMRCMVENKKVEDKAVTLERIKNMNKDEQRKPE